MTRIKFQMRIIIFGYPKSTTLSLYTIENNIKIKNIEQSCTLWCTTMLYVFGIIENAEIRIFCFVYQSTFRNLKLVASGHKFSSKTGILFLYFWYFVLFFHPFLRNLACIIYSRRDLYKTVIEKNRQMVYH